MTCRPYVEWRDGSFGGEKYHNSTYPTYEASQMILQMLQGKDVKLKSLLNSVNKLENAVHNTGFFFNKFLGDKDAFNIGTTGHRDFKSACEHWLVTAPFYAMFYTNYVNEPHRVAKGHDKLIAHLYEQVKRHHREDTKMRDNIAEFLAFSYKEGTLKANIQGNTTIAPHEHFYTEQLERDYRMHKEGMCGYDQCTSSECKQSAILIAMGIDETVLAKLLDHLSEYMNWPAFSFHQEPDSLETVEDVILSKGNRAPSQTAFREKERKITAPEMSVVRIGEKNGWDFDAWSLQVNNSDSKTIYIDHVLKGWWDEITDTVTELESEPTIQQYDAWKNPEPWIGDRLMDEVRGLDKILSEEGEFTFYSRYWSPSYDAYKDPIGLIKSMLVAHDGRHEYNTHSLLRELYEAGKVNEINGEIK